MNVWDVIVVGTGVGGATLGHALAAKGLRVLFLEKGLSNVEGGSSLRGAYLEDLALEQNLSLADSEVWRRSGRWKASVANHQDVSRIEDVILGTGTGGSSALYGMAMERFFPSDFEPKKFHPGAEESTLPDRWPISYQELESYYVRAEGYKENKAAF